MYDTFLQHIHILKIHILCRIHYSVLNSVMSYSSSQITWTMYWDPSSVFSYWRVVKTKNCTLSEELTIFWNVVFSLSGLSSQDFIFQSDWLDSSFVSHISDCHHGLPHLHLLIMSRWTGNTKVVIFYLDQAMCKM